MIKMQKKKVHAGKILKSEIVDLQSKWRGQEKRGIVK